MREKEEEGAVSSHRLLTLLLLLDAGRSQYMRARAISLATTTRLNRDQGRERVAWTVAKRSDRTVNWVVHGYDILLLWQHIGMYTYVHTCGMSKKGQLVLIFFPQYQCVCERETDREGEPALEVPPQVLCSLAEIYASEQQKKLLSLS